MAKVAPIPVISMILTLMIVHMYNMPTGQRYYTYMMQGVPITLPMIIYIVVLQLAVATVMYLIVKSRRVRAARLGFYIITVMLSFFSLYATLYAAFANLSNGDLLSLVFSIIFTPVLVKMIDSENHNIKYIGFLIVCILASLSLIEYLYDTSLIFLILLLMPIMDVVLVYWGPLGKSIQEIKKRRQETTIDSKEHVETSSRDSSSIITKLTVRIDGIMLGIGDFLLYSLASMWSVELLAGLLPPIGLAIYFIVYTLLFLLSFYINIKLCLRRGYGPASPLPLIAAVATTLLSYYLLTLK
ncbi:MAG: hypothetical protein GXO23_01670 [Crenarchaeota archaeon]|nr:hypothetical protein [Thermoproteota archaeon]